MSNLSERDFDLVIVGASFAGLTCAKTAAMRGLKVAVLERKAEPGARVHTTGILVKEAADEIDIPSMLTRKVRGVRLYAPSQRHIDLFAPGYYFLATDTPGLLRWLARDAVRAGARLFCGTRFEGAERDGERIRIGHLDITARYIVGADGAKSRVAEVFGLGRNAHFLVGLEAEYHGLKSLDTRFLHCFLDTRLAPGYIGWAVPGCGLTQVGLATRDIDKPDLAAFEDRVKDVLHLEEGRIAGRRSGVIPVGGLVKPYSAPGVLLVGDAAGLVSPLTGGGIKLAFELGRRSAQVISDYLQDRGGEPGRVLAAEYPTYARKRILRRLMNIAPPNWTWDLILNTPLMGWAAQQVYFHRRRAEGARLEAPSGDSKGSADSLAGIAGNSA